MKKVKRRDKVFVSMLNCLLVFITAITPLHAHTHTQQLSRMTEQLEYVLLDIILPLLHSPSLPPPLAGDEDREKVID